MKNTHVFIIVAAIVVIAYIWYQSASTCGTNNPTNATSPGFVAQGPLPCGGNLNTGPIT